MNAHEVIQLDEEEIKRAEQDARDIEKEDGNRRKRWLRIGNVLAKFRAKYSSNKEYGERVRASFPNYDRITAWAAIWWATKIDAETRIVCEKKWPDITTPKNIYTVWMSYQQELAEKCDDSWEENPLLLQSNNADLSMIEPENTEIPAPTPEIQAEEAQEKPLDPLDEIKIKPNNPLLIHGIKESDAKTLLAFYPDSNVRRIFYQIARQGIEQRKWLAKIAGEIRSGEIGSENRLSVGLLPEGTNARIIHSALPKKFAAQWEFGSGKIKPLNKLLADARKLYAVGEAIKGYPTPAKRTAQAFDEWHKLNQKPAAEPLSLPAPSCVAAEPAHENDATPTEKQQTIKVCGKTFWPPSEYCRLQYHQVWGTALFVKLTYKTIVDQGKENPSDVIAGMMMAARALRLGAGDSGSLYHQILAQMREHIEWIEDPAHTQWPANGIGKPPEYDN